MIIKFNPGALSEIQPHEYIVRFLLGGAICIATGLIAQRYGPVVGGLFLAFPAIFPASATLVERHERQRKAKAGIRSTVRGRLSAALDARGASMGALALIVFAAIVWKLLPFYNAGFVLLAATVAWAALSATLWRLRRWHTRLWIRWQSARRR